MTPTPAQIEAVTGYDANGNFLSSQQLVDEIDRLRGRVAALTAAAEVADRKQFVMGAFATPPATAEVADARITKREYDDALDDMRQATIERCVDAAEWFHNIQSYSLDDIIARIRALLKDK